jgi:hypothetical protein
MEYNFTGRKPSNAQVLKKINEGINRGEDLIELYWGENSITLDKSNGMWHGWGWIRNISGADLAVKINEASQEKFQRDHFQFIRVGF